MKLVGQGVSQHLFVKSPVVDMFSFVATLHPGGFIVKVGTDSRRIRGRGCVPTELVCCKNMLCAVVFHNLF